VWISEDMIVVVDYGMGNIGSVCNALRYVGAQIEVTSSPDALARAEGIVVPGVGAFGDGMSNLRANGLVDVLTEHILVKKKPYLGICLGMQFLAELSLQGGRSAGLEIIPGKVERLSPSEAAWPKV
jgi:glutamine amidotransferase